MYPQELNSLIVVCVLQSPFFLRLGMSPMVVLLLGFILLAKQIALLTHCFLSDAILLIDAFIILYARPDSPLLRKALVLPS